MPRSQLRGIFKEFNSEINRAFNLISAINESIASGNKLLRIEYIHHVTEYAFLRIFTAWERFLETSFIAYLAGASVKSFKPRILLKKVKKDHAIKILKGTQTYQDWTKVENVLTLAELFFIDEKPYELPLKEIQKYLNDMRKIRNAIVHISIRSKERFQSLVRSELSSYYADISPGEFLLKKRKKGSETYLEYYTSFLETASRLFHK